MLRVIAALSLTLFACNTEPTADAGQPPSQDLPAGHPAVGGGMGGIGGMGGMGGTQASAQVALSGTVVETMEAGGYTYAKLDAKGEEIWVAGPITPGVTVGATLGVPDGMIMKDFSSPTLGRTFDEIYFVGALVLEGQVDAAPAGHGALPPVPASDIAVQAPEGGLTVAQAISRAKELEGTEVLLRGQVVKFNANIMGSNWLHIQDGSGTAASGDHDLTVTSSDSVAVGDVVLVKGTIVTDRDFGSGYEYAVMVEKASLTKE